MANTTARHRVLIVDDNRDAADTLALLISMEGHEVRCAYGGVEALVQAQLFHPDLVVLDLNMPGMDGFETAKALKSRIPAPVVVALSADATEATRERVAQIGFDHQYVKPADAACVLELLGTRPSASAS